MAVVIDESILLFFAGAIFLPLIIFLVKLIIDFGIVKGKLEEMLRVKEEHESKLEKIDGMSNRVTVLEIKVERVEKDLIVAIDKRPIKRLSLDEEDERNEGGGKVRGR